MLPFACISKDQARKIHWASLEILERLGARLHHQEAIDLLKKGGADVSDGNLVRVPPGMVEKAFTTVPKRVVLCDRYGKPTMPLEGNRCFYGPGSDCLNIIDHRTGERRKPILQDVVEGTTVCDALLNVDFAMSMVLPVDVEQAIADTYQMEAMLSHPLYTFGDRRRHQPDHARRCRGPRQRRSAARTGDLPVAARRRSACDARHAAFADGYAHHGLGVC